MMRSRFSARLPAPTSAVARVPIASLLVLTAIVIALCRPVSGLAQEAAESLENGPVIIYESPLEQRRAELRQALISDDGNYHAGRERRKLSPEERSALNEELRAAMRAVYEQQRVTQSR
jgi:hypothetical protein